MGSDLLIRDGERGCAGVNIFPSIIPSNLCIFCYKNFKSIGGNSFDDELVDLNTFINLLGRYLEVGKGDNLGIESFLALLRDNWKILGCCIDCTNIINSFCDIYHQLKSLELQLEWRLQTLVSIMRLANRVPSRLENAKRIIQIDRESEEPMKSGQEILKNVKAFRQHVIRKCVRKLSNSLPRVSVERIVSPVTADQQLIISSEFVLNLDHSEITSEDDVLLIGNENDEDNEVASSKAIKVEPPPESKNLSEELTSVKKKMEASVNDVGTREEYEMTEDPPSPVEIEQNDTDSNEDFIIERYNLPNKTESQSQLEQNENAMTTKYSSENVDEEQSTTPAEKETETENKKFENLPSASARYCLRAKRKRTFHEIPELTENETDDDNDNSSTLSPDNIENSSSTSSDDDSSSTESGDAATSSAPIPRKRGRPRKIKIQNTVTDTDATPIPEVLPKKGGRPRKLNTATATKCDKVKTRKKWQRKYVGKNGSEQQKVKVGVKPESKIKCKLCNRNFAKFSSLNNHERLYHNPDATQSFENPLKDRVGNFICPVVQCPEKFQTRRNLDNHQKLHANFKCSFCDIVKDYAPELALHEMEHSELEANTRIRYHKFSVDTQKKRSFKCARCGFTFTMKYPYIRHHLETHLNLVSTTDTCLICAATGSGKGFLNKHFIAFHKTDGLDPSKIQRCDQCPAYFVKRVQLVKHKGYIHYQKKCSECDKVFLTGARLRNHMDVTHSIHIMDDSKYPCDIGACEKVFSKASLLKIHKEKYHNFGGTLIKCSKCDKEFGNMLRLQKHMRNVHVASSFVCSECGKAFKRGYSLKEHSKYHQGPDSWKFQCSQCGRKFVDQHKLKQHMRTHTKEKPFICQFCGEKYAHRHNWRNHMKTKHDYEENQKKTGERDKANCLSRKGSTKGDCIISGQQQT